jgi:hypothetical protein
VILGVLGALVLVAFTACDEGSDVRTLRIAVGDAGCTPTEFEVAPAQRVRLLIENDSDDAFIITSEGAELEDIHVEGDDDAESFLTVPPESGTYALHCEREGGDQSEILLVARTDADLTPVSNPTPGPGQPQTLGVSLADFTISPSATVLTPGQHNIVATNTSQTEEHDLHVLSLQPDGSFSPIASIPPIPPQEGGAVLVNLLRGTYRLACQIGIGQEGSEVDHYQQGMWVDVLVE